MAKYFLDDPFSLPKPVLFCVYAAWTATGHHTIAQQLAGPAQQQEHQQAAPGLAPQAQAPQPAEGSIGEVCCLLCVAARCGKWASFYVQARGMCDGMVNLVNTHNRMQQFFEGQSFE